MGTRSFIIVPNPKGDYTGIYCHWDGYPEGVGRTLEQHYTSKAKIRKLINLGDISSLKPEIDPAGPHSFDEPWSGVTVAYGRDRGDNGVGARTRDTLQHLVTIAASMWCEYVYLHFNGVWHVNTIEDAMDGKAYKTVLETIREEAA